MCGICGKISRRKTETELRVLLQSMLDSMKWRGPDGRGIYIDNVGNDELLGLGQCRLSIFDLSENGKQPMYSSDGMSVIVYNGEVYNFNEIRHELEQSGYSFKSTCDTEVLLYACNHWGVKKAVSKMNGMLAFAYYDKKSRNLYLIRDRLGVKPLYYYKTENDFVFGSDLRVFMADKEIEKKINRQALYGYLWNMYIPAPLSIYDNVFKLESGTILKYELKSSEISIERYWDMNNIDNNLFYSNEIDILTELKSKLVNSVKLRLEADVPVGVFLSGGIDSSLITAIASENSTQKINTYSIGFHDKKNDDADYADSVSRILGSNHEKLFCTQKDALDMIMDIPKAYSEPFADNSQIPTMLLSKLTKRYVTVGLTGDGGDELFCGYPSYIFQKKLYNNKFLLQILKKLIRKPVDLYCDIYNYKRWLVDKFTNITDVESVVNLDYFTAVPLLNSILKVDEGVDDFYWNSTSVHKKDEVISLSMKNGLRYGLQDDMLVKVDRASMYYSLECRSPFLDKNVVEYAINMPLSMKYKNRQLKYPLRQLLAQYIPYDIINRPKSGFGVPINKWMHEELKESIVSLMDDNFIKTEDIFDCDGIKALRKAFLERSSPIIDRVVYTLFMFQLWYMEYYK